MPIESHLLMDGALHVYRRENSQVLKTANRKGWIAALPDMSAL